MSRDDFCSSMDRLMRSRTLSGVGGSINGVDMIGKSLNPGVFRAATVAAGSSTGISSAFAVGTALIGVLSIVVTATAETDSGTESTTIAGSTFIDTPGTGN